MTSEFQKRQQVELLESLHRRMIDEVSDYAIILLDADGNIMSWNKGAEMIKGYTEEEVIGKNLSMFYLPEDQKAGLPAKLLKKASKEGRTKYVGKRVRKDGSVFWASMVITALHDDNNNVVGFTKLTREIPEGFDGKSS